MQCQGSLEATCQRQGRDREDAEKRVKAVFSVLCDTMPGEMEDVMSQLPEDYAPLFE